MRRPSSPWLLVLLLGVVPGALAQDDAAAAAQPATLDVVAAARGVVGPPQGPARAGAALEEATARVADLLRCPVCQGLSVGDSPATMAQDMRAQVRELLAAGFDDEQVLAYFEASYGEFVRLAPPLRGVNWLVWLAPALGLVAGLGIVTWVLRGAGPRRTETVDATVIEPAKAPAVAPAPGGEAVLDPLPDDPALARAVLRVRETAYGWPDGRRPGQA